MHTRQGTNLILASVIDLALHYSSPHLFFFLLDSFFPFDPLKLNATASEQDLGLSNTDDMLCGFAGTGIIL